MKTIKLTKWYLMMLINGEGVNVSVYGYKKVALT